MNNKGKKSVFSNLIWRLAERTGAQIVALIVSIVLARILEPNAYGTISLVIIFTSILQVFVDSGLGNALIQKKDTDNVDFSTVFYINILFCIILYLILFFSAPFLANFYNDNSLVAYFRVLGITVIVSGVKNVQQAYVSRNMLFKKFFFSTLGGTIIAGICGVILAVNGFGAWALVAQQVINVTIDTIILWITVDWRPERAFSFQRLKTLFAYGSKLLVSALIDTGYNNLRQLLIGKVFSPADLAYYNEGQKLPSVIITNVNSSIDSVLLPAMASEQDNVERVKSMTRNSIKISVYIMAPLMMGMAFVAEPMIKFLLTDKWLPCVDYLRIFCISFMFYPIHTANLNAIKAMGRSDLFLKLEIIKKIVGIITIIVLIRYGVLVLAYGVLLSSFLNQIINSYPNRRILGYSYFEQLKDILPSIFLAIVMGGIIYPLQFINMPLIFCLLLQIISGGVIYIVGSYICKLDSFRYLLDIIRSYKNKKTGVKNE